MGKHTDLAPQTIVPVAGRYQCQACPSGDAAGAAGQGTVWFFEVGATFVQCPTCGDATRWTLVEASGGAAEEAAEAPAKEGPAAPAADAAHVEEQVRAIICEKLSVKPEQVTPATSFVNDLGADSLDQVELVMEFEDKFGMQIPDEEAEKLQTVGDAIRYVVAHQGQS